MTRGDARQDRDISVGGVFGAIATAIQVIASVVALTFGVRLAISGLIFFAVVMIIIYQRSRGVLTMQRTSWFIGLTLVSFAVLVGWQYWQRSPEDGASPAARSDILWVRFLTFADLNKDSKKDINERKVSGIPITVQWPNYEESVELNPSGVTNSKPFVADASNASILATVCRMTRTRSVDPTKTSPANPMMIALGVDAKNRAVCSAGIQP